MKPTNEIFIIYYIIICKYDIFIVTFFVKLKKKLTIKK